MCREVAKILDGNKDKYLVPFKETAASTDNYQAVDLDNDSIPDSIVRSRGYGNPKVYSLFVSLSSGNKMEMEFNPFYLINYRENILLIENKNQIWKIGSENIVRACN